QNGLWLFNDDDFAGFIGAGAAGLVNLVNVDPARDFLAGGVANVPEDVLAAGRRQRLNESSIGCVDSNVAVRAQRCEGDSGQARILFERTRVGVPAADVTI